MGKPLGLLKPFSYQLHFREIRTVLRTGAWSLFLKSVGIGSKIDEGVTIRYHPAKLSIGKYTHLDTHSQFELYERLRIGDYVHICPNVYIQSGDKVFIDDYACVSNGTRIYSKSNTYDGSEGLVSLSSNAPVKNQRFKSGKVHIKRNAFIGVNSVIMPGVVIGENAIVGACSLITKDVPANTIVGGVPAKVIKKLPTKKRKKR
jgi:acetyltransferase-like isoleucine patch superfamily enzyme